MNSVLKLQEINNDERNIGPTILTTVVTLYDLSTVSNHCGK